MKQKPHRLTVEYLDTEWNLYVNSDNGIHFGKVVLNGINRKPEMVCGIIKMLVETHGLYAVAFEHITLIGEGLNTADICLALELIQH